MRSLHIAFSIMLAATTAAAAAETPTRSQTPPESLSPGAPLPHRELTVGEVIDITSALSSLDSHQSGVLDTGGTPVTAPNGFKFGGHVRMTIALDIARGKEVLKNYNEALVALRVQMAGAGHDVPKDKMDDWVRETRKMIDAPSGLTMGRIKEQDLCLDVRPPECPAANEIPVAVLSQLLPIMDH